MMRIFGVITERLLEKFGEDSPGWHPTRGGGKVNKDAAKHAEGHKVGKGPGRTKK